ncbi:MAG: hypothetical protein JWP35_3129 [Caulobacter sp.]|nr:hypothetical protein [Caulobacter sp.]
MPLAQALFLAGVITVFVTFGVTLFSVYLYVNINPRKPAPQVRPAVQREPVARLTA